MTANINGDVLSTVGNTPLVRIGKLVGDSGVTVYAKLEGYNPAGSVKDRIAKSMVEEAERSGQLTKDMIIIEPTSGNTGIGLAMVAAAKGYKLQVLMPETMSIERRKILMALGAEIILTPGEEGMPGAICRAQTLAQKPGYFMPNQFANPANVQAHYEGTGREILEQMSQIDVFVAGLGTSGTLMGAGRRLKEANPKTKIVAVEPHPKSKIQGLRSLQEGYIPPIFDPQLLDEKVLVSDGEAFAMARQLLKVEGLSVGISSGAAMVETKRQVEKMKGGTLVVIFPDRSERYLSTALFEKGR